MSWSAYGTLTGTTIEYTSQVAIDSDESKAQFDAAEKAVKALVKSGAVGDPKGTYNIALSGHANPGHEPQIGWANDNITVAASQAQEVQA